MNEKFSFCRLPLLNVIFILEIKKVIESRINLYWWNYIDSQQIFVASMCQLRSYRAETFRLEKTNDYNEQICEPVPESHSMTRMATEKQRERENDPK